MVQPDDPVNADGTEQSGVLKSAAKGHVVQVLAQDGQLVHTGDAILQLDDPQVRRDLAYYTAKVREAEAKMRQSRVEDQIEFIKDAEDLAVWHKELDDAKRRDADLKITAPFAGRLIAPALHELPDTVVQPGQEIGRVAVLDQLVIKGDIDQKDFELIQLARGPRDVKVEVRLAGLLGHATAGGALTLAPRRGVGTGACLPRLARRRRPSGRSPRPQRNSHPVAHLRGLHQARQSKRILSIPASARSSA